jgi:hypothetical protein
MAARHSQIVQIVEIRQKLTEQVAKLDYIRYFEKKTSIDLHFSDSILNRKSKFS